MDDIMKTVKIFEDPGLLKKDVAKKNRYIGCKFIREYVIRQRNKSNETKPRSHGTR